MQFIGQSWMMQVDGVPNKSSHTFTPDDVKGFNKNASHGDLLWFFTSGKLNAVASYESVSDDGVVTYNKFYDVSESNFHPSLPIYSTTISAYHEYGIVWLWYPNVEYVYISRYSKPV
jgi:hypothetical protein